MGPPNFICLCVGVCVCVCPAFTACIKVTMGWILMKLGRNDETQIRLIVYNFIKIDTVMTTLWCHIDFFVILQRDRILSQREMISFGLNGAFKIEIYFRTDKNTQTDSDILLLYMIRDLSSERQIERQTHKHTHTETDIFLLIQDGVEQKMS